MTIYAFPEPGEYYVKASLIIPDKEGNKIIDSDPVKIMVAEPEDESLEVWRRIKDRADFAYFIQEGEVVDFKKAKDKVKFQLEVEQIIDTYPNSFYAQPLSQSLMKLKEKETRRKAHLEQLKQQKQLFLL